MSLYDYKEGKKISALDPPFYAIIMAAMRQADSNNLALLTDCWPSVYVELRRRYDAPGGIIEGDREYVRP